MAEEVETRLSFEGNIEGVDGTIDSMDVHSREGSVPIHGLSLLDREYLQGQSEREGGHWKGAKGENLDQSRPSALLSLSLLPRQSRMIKSISLITLAYSTWITLTTSHQWLYGLPIIACSLCVLISNETSRVWRILSSVALLSTSVLSLFLITTLQSIASTPSIQLTEISHLLPLGISLLLLVSLRIKSSSNFLQSVLLYLIAGSGLLSVLYSLTQYYIPNTVRVASR